MMMRQSDFTAISSTGALACTCMGTMGAQVYPRKTAKAVILRGLAWWMSAALDRPGQAEALLCGQPD